MDTPIKVLFLTPEAAPYAKTGGLGDMAGALSKALANLGVEVWLTLPGYQMALKAGLERKLVLNDLKVDVGADLLKGEVSEYLPGKGPKVYFVEREDLFDRPNLYGTGDEEYYDNLQRFIFFCRASLLLAKRMNFKPDIIHCHDWQTGLAPCYLKTLYARDPFFARTASVFTVHNIGYQGLFPGERLPLTGLPYSLFNPSGLEFYGNISFLKAGIVFSDTVTTVSPQYSREIVTPDFGEGLDGLLREVSGKLVGILNGADYEVWNPETDPHLPASYGPLDLSGKKSCKQALIEEAGLDKAQSDRLLIGVVTRMTRQKGVDLVLEAVEDLINEGAGLVTLGQGEQEYLDGFRELERRHPGQVKNIFRFDEGLAHRIIAGVDLFLIPSRYEPCGLTQMYALRYGTVPLINATGGLKDTVTAFDEQTGTGNGFVMNDFRADELKAQLRRASELFENRERWTILQRNGMAADFSWDRSARSYIEVYRRLIEEFEAPKPNDRAG